MRWRSMAGHTHPLATPLLGAVVACAFGSLYSFFNIGGTPLHGALTFAILYGSIVAVIFGIAGIVWCAIKLLAIRGRSVAGRNDRKSGFPQTVMSAFIPKADVCGARGDVG